MPEKRYKRGCGPGYVGCWVNNLKHGNKEAKAYLKKHPELEWNAVHNARPKQLSKLEQRTIKQQEYKVCDSGAASEYEQIEKDLQKAIEDAKEYTVYY